VAEPYEIGIDIEMSFAEGSAGFLAKKIILSNGTKALDDYFWQYGQSAYKAIKEGDYFAQVQSHRNHCNYGAERSDYGVFVECLIRVCDVLQPAIVLSIEESRQPEKAKTSSLSMFEIWAELTEVQKMFAVSKFWLGYGSVMVSANIVRGVIAGEKIIDEKGLTTLFSSVSAALNLHFLYSMVDASACGEILRFGRLASLLNELSFKPMKIVDGIGLATITTQLLIQHQRKALNDSSAKESRIDTKTITDYYKSHCNDMRDGRSIYKTEILDDLMKTGAVALARSTVERKLRKLKK
jgi:hypothetical protein